MQSYQSNPGLFPAGIRAESWPFSCWYPSRAGIRRRHFLRLHYYQFLLLWHRREAGSDVHRSRNFYGIEEKLIVMYIEAETGSDVRDEREVDETSTL